MSKSRSETRNVEGESGTFYHNKEVCHERIRDRIWVE